MKGYSAFPKAPALLEPHHQIFQCHTQETRWESLIPLQRCSRCILQPQPTSRLKLVDKFSYLVSSVSSTENDINTWLAKAWTAIDRLSIMWNSDQSDKIKHDFFQAAVESILLYGCTTLMLTKRIEKQLNAKCRRMLQAILNKWRKQHTTNQQLCVYLPPIFKSI